MQTYHYGAITLYCPSSQMVRIHLHSDIVVLQPHGSRDCHGLGYSLFARHY